MACKYLINSYLGPLTNTYIYLRILTKYIHSSNDGGVACFAYLLIRKRCIDTKKLVGAENINALFAQSAEVKTEVMDCMKQGGQQIQNACAELQVEIVEKEGGGFDVKTKEKDGPQDAPAVGPSKKSGAATARL